jgi:thiamine biosynthesis lipoprotein
MTIAANGADSEAAVNGARDAVLALGSEITDGASSADVDAILSLAEEMRGLTGGAFDIRYPGSENAAAGSGFDLGGIAKGYAADLAADSLRSAGVTSALIDLGGNIYAVGVKPDGGPWRVGIRNPFPDGADSPYAGVLSLTDLSAVTSGEYERGAHIIDPGTGEAAQSGLASITVIGESSAVCDALATAFYVMGLEKSLGLLRDTDVALGAVFVSNGGAITITRGVAEIFTSESAYEIAD